MKTFYLKYRGANGQRVVSYIYDQTAPNQKGLTFEEWKERCIEFALGNGLEYIGDATAEEWINQK